jgi:hypothetical protein
MLLHANFGSLKCLAMVRVRVRVRVSLTLTLTLALALTPTLALTLTLALALALALTRCVAKYMQLHGGSCDAWGRLLAGTATLANPTKRETKVSPEAP